MGARLITLDSAARLSLLCASPLHETIGKALLRSSVCRPKTIDVMRHLVNKDVGEKELPEFVDVPVLGKI